MTYSEFPDLASERVGGRVIAANDEFFAPKRNLVSATAPVFVPDKFTPRGKWMDGWETRRRRTPGHDWCVVALGIRGIVHGVDVDTTHFTGNYPSHCSLDAVDLRRPPDRKLCAREGAPWVRVLDESALQGNAHNLFEVHHAQPVTHLRLNIHPDGGVARFRVHGEAVVDWPRLARTRRLVDLAAIVHGGVVLAASDMHFGVPQNLIMPGRAKNMGDGWETRRRRGPGDDWTVVQLGTPGVIARVEVDTNHFKGNYPESCSLEGCLAPEATLEALDAAPWQSLLPRAQLRPHARHVFARELSQTGPISHVKLRIFPDGGVSRLRLFGTPLVE